jgi:hypothetical protein
MYYKILITTITGLLFNIFSISFSLNAGNLHCESEQDRSGLSPVVPFRFFQEEEERMFAQMIEMKEKYGLCRFLIVEPTDEVKLLGYPSDSLFVKIGKRILAIKNRMQKHGIEIGWWCAPSLRMGPNAPFQYITDITGRVANATPCPLDKDFQDDFAKKIAIVAKIAKPFRIQIEDDYEISWHPFDINFGCFCPAHLREFSRCQGHEYQREELESIFRGVNSQSIELRKAWSEVAKRSLVDLAIKVRARLDEVDSTVQITLCQSAAADFDGNFTEEVAEAFAGNTQPSVRLYGSGYSVDKLTAIPEYLFHVLYCKQHLPSHFELLHESDTYPHTRYFTSANMMRSLMIGALSCGLDDFLFYPTQYLDNPLEEKAYVEMYKDEEKRLLALKNSVRNTEVVGCEILYLPDAHVTKPYNSEKAHPLWNTIYHNGWISVLGRYGIPYTSKKEKVKFVSGNILDMMTDEKVKEVLSEGVFLDGEAAISLYNRGFGELIGVVAITQGKKPDFCFESIRHPENFDKIEGKLMYNLMFAPAGSEVGSEFYEIFPMKEAVVITDFLNPRKESVIPGLITFENRLGGRIAITAYNISSNESSSIFNYKKKELVREIINWLGKEALAISVLDQPNTFCIFNQSIDKKKGILTCVNMTADIFDSFSIIVSEHWENSKIEVLLKDGNWAPVEHIDKKNIKTISIAMAPLSPLVLKFTKSK